MTSRHGFTQIMLTSAAAAVMTVSFTGNAIAQSAAGEKVMKDGEKMMKKEMKDGEKMMKEEMKGGEKMMKKEMKDGEKMMKEEMHGEKKMMDKVQVGLDGYCPVCIIDARKWERGSEEIASTFDGVTYYFPTAAIQAKFDNNPQRYVPALNGDCIVCLEKAGKRVPGSVYHASLLQDRLYLFPSEKEKAVFSSNPEAYIDTDIAENGECIVCLVKADKHVPGSPQHTVIHDGLRYLFPSDREADVFRANPDEYVMATMKKMDGDKMIKTRFEDPAGETVTVAGRSGCAACEFGVTPIASPEELGLAIVGEGGRVTVIEDAHRNNPEIYKNRFQDLQLVARGEIIRQEGKVTWLKPSSLQLAP